MSLLKTFGVENQQMMFSELLDHITKEAVDDLFDADPSEEALQKGVLGALCVRSLFWLHLFHVLRYVACDGKVERKVFVYAQIVPVLHSVRDSGPGKIALRPQGE